jgi:triosephosphate isomerase
VEGKDLIAKDSNGNSLNLIDETIKHFISQFLHLFIDTPSSQERVTHILYGGSISTKQKNKKVAFRRKL